MFSFALVSRQWSQVATEAIVQWCKAGYTGSRGPYDQEMYDRFWGAHSLSTPRQPEELTTEFCLSFYYAWHMARLSHAWSLVVPEEEKPAEEIIHTKFHLAHLQLRDVFYWDDEKEAFQPLKLMPGLRTLELPEKEPELKEIVVNDLRLQLETAPESERVAMRARNKLILSALDKRKGLKLQKDVIALAGTKRLSHKPHKNTPLRNAVLNGQFLLAKRVRRPLQLHIHRLRSLSLEKRARILTLDHEGPSLARRLHMRLRDLAKPPTPAVPVQVDLDDDESDNDDSEITVEQIGDVFAGLFK